MKWEIQMIISLTFFPFITTQLRRHNRIDNGFAYFFIVLLCPLLYFASKAPLLPLFTILLLDQPLFFILHSLHMPHLVLDEFLHWPFPLDIIMRIFIVLDLIRILAITLRGNHPGGRIANDWCSDRASTGNKFRLERIWIKDLLLLILGSIYDLFADLTFLLSKLI